MNFKKAQEYLLSKPEAVLDYPFGPDVAVFKILSKMFATLSIIGEHSHMNLKCDPSEAFELRDMFDAVRPGYHMNKKHWNTIILNGTIPVSEIQRMIDSSYGLVVAKLSRVERLGLESRHDRQKLHF